MGSVLNFLFNTNLWWTVRIFLGITVIVMLLGLIKRKQKYIIIFGLLIVLAALPTGFWLEIDISGCCGAPQSPYQGAGLLIGLIMAIIGILIVAFSKKFAKK